MPQMEKHCNTHNGGMDSEDGRILIIDQFDQG